jgi:hypothetical protein
MQRLTRGQRARIEEFAREAGTTCEDRGSTRLRYGEEARRIHDHRLLVYLWCDSDVHPR